MHPVEAAFSIDCGALSMSLQLQLLLSFVQSTSIFQAPAVCQEIRTDTCYLPPELTKNDRKKCEIKAVIRAVKESPWGSGKAALR